MNANNLAKQRLRRAGMLLLGGALGAGTPGLALAHNGQPPAPHDLWSAWALEPLLLLGLVLCAAAYWYGARRLWRRAGPGHGVGVWQAAAFISGLGVLAIALISPLDALSHALFSAHMAQHMLLILVAAPLLALGAPLGPLLAAVPGRWRGWRNRRLIRSASWFAQHSANVPLALAGHALAITTWHAPLLYEMALRSPTVHIVEHACFVATAVWFWWSVLRARGLSAVLALFVLALTGTLLGSLMTFAPRPWYPSYSQWTAAWGLTPLEDQQIAGLTMWLPGGLIYLLATLALLANWLNAVERRVRQAEAR